MGVIGLFTGVLLSVICYKGYRKRKGHKWKAPANPGKSGSLTVPSRQASEAGGGTDYVPPNQVRPKPHGFPQHARNDSVVCLKKYYFFSSKFANIFAFILFLFLKVTMKRKEDNKKTRITTIDSKYLKLITNLIDVEVNHFRRQMCKTTHNFMEWFQQWNKKWVLNIKSMWHLQINN